MCNLDDKHSTRSLSFEPKPLIEARDSEEPGSTEPSGSAKMCGKQVHFDALFLTVLTNPMIDIPDSVGETREVVNNIE